MSLKQKADNTQETCWKINGVSHEEALLIKNVLEFRESLLEIDEWIPFPQNCCCYTFAEKGSTKPGRPLPICILTYLWDYWKDFTGKCPKCGGRIYGFGFGGLLSSGGVVGCCIQCEAELSRQVGGFLKVGDTVQELLLTSSPYKICHGRFGGAYRGERIPLVKALNRLGAENLPINDWVLDKEPNHVSFTVTCPPYVGPVKSGTITGGRMDETKFAG